MICSPDVKRRKECKGSGSREAAQLNDGVSSRQHRADDGVVQATRVRLRALSAWGSRSCVVMRLRFSYNSSQSTSRRMILAGEAATYSRERSQNHLLYFIARSIAAFV